MVRDGAASLRRLVGEVTSGRRVAGETSDHQVVEVTSDPPVGEMTSDPHQVLNATWDHPKMAMVLGGRQDFDG